MKKIYIHAGLHKTGTTSLQLALLKNQKRLFEQGVLYPRTGIPQRLYGHHNIAWELCRDRRYRASNGNLEALFREIHAFEKNTVILSSEDFESSLLHPRRFNKIIDFFEKKNFEVCFVVYVRNQSDYFLSMYAELLKAGLGDEFVKFFSKASSAKKFEYKEWEILFNYSEIASSLQTLKTTKVLFRDYESLEGGSTIVDFCNLVGIDRSKLELPEEISRINQRLKLDFSLKLFARNRISEFEREFTKIIDQLLMDDKKTMALPCELQTRIETIFRNDFPFQRTNANPIRQPEMNSLSMPKVFSHDTCNLIVTLSQMNHEPMTQRKLMDRWLEWASTVD